MFHRLLGTGLIAALASTSIPAVSLAYEDAPAVPTSEMQTRVYQVADLVTPISTVTGRIPDFESLLDLIELRTGVECWGQEAGAVTPHEATLSLVVRQTAENHNRVAHLLDELRRTGNQVIQVEVQFIEGDLDSCGVKTNRTAEGIVDASGRKALVSAVKATECGKVLGTNKLTMLNGQSAYVKASKNPEQAAVGENCIRADVRGVISYDSQYVRLWVDTKVGDQVSHDELLVPDGFTGVRKLESGRWVMATVRVINSVGPEEVANFKPEADAAESTPATPRKKYTVPVDDSLETLDVTLIPVPEAEAREIGSAIRQVAAIAVEEVPAPPGLEAAGPVLLTEQPVLASIPQRVAYRLAGQEPQSPVQVVMNDCGRPGTACHVAPLASLKQAAQLGKSQAVMNHEAEASGIVMVDLEVPEVAAAPEQDARQAAPGQAFVRVERRFMPGQSMVQAPRQIPTDSGDYQFLEPAPFRRIAPVAGTVVVSRVASDENRVSPDLHLDQAARDLEALGLKAEAAQIRSLMGAVCLKARMRVEEIDAQIARLKAERDRLETLPTIQVSGPIHLLGVPASDSVQK